MSPYYICIFKIQFVGPIRKQFKHN
jgi:hypothetical protein